MFSPSPVSLICAILLCLPLAIVLTITTPLTTTISGGATTIPTPFTATTDGGCATTSTTRGAIKHNSTTSTRGTRSGASITATSGATATHAIKSSATSTATSGATATRAIKSSATSTVRNKTRINHVIQIPKSTLHSTRKRYENTENKTAAPPPEDDELLFSRAAVVNSTLSQVGPPKVAFMFLTTSPLPFAPLWELYFNNTPKNLYNIYIHADPSSKYDTPFTGVFANRLIPSVPTRRYSPTLASAARRLLAHALLHDPQNYMFALLSPSCIPLRSFNFTYGVLTKSKKSFVEILKNEVGAADRWAARGPHAMLPEVTVEDFRIGSQFFSLTRKHARVVASDRRLWSKFKLPCVDRYTCYPEEHYFATLLSMVDPRGCVPATLTHVDWRGRHDGHPRTYSASGVGPDLIVTLRKCRPRYGDDGINGSDSSVRKRNDPFLFGRKFSVDSVVPLLNIANDVIFKD